MFSPSSYYSSGGSSSRRKRSSHALPTMTPPPLRSSTSSLVRQSPRSSPRSKFATSNDQKRWDLGFLFLCGFLFLQALMAVYLLQQFELDWRTTTQSTFDNSSMLVGMAQTTTTNNSSKLVGTGGGGGERGHSSSLFQGMFGNLGFGWFHRTAKKGRTRKRQRHRGWDPGRDGLKEPAPLKVSFPIFVASLSKSGTTSIWQYFNCGGHPASHQWIKRDDNNKTEEAGLCIWKNIRDGNKPFHNCGSKRIYTDTSYARFIGNKVEGEPLCYYPTIEALPDIFEAYPNGTLLFVIRDSLSWYNSTARWGNGTLLKRFYDCDLPHYPREDKIVPAKDVMDWYDWHTKRVRKFAQKNPHINYIEVALEGVDTPFILEERIGIPAWCWGQCTPTSKFCKKFVNETNATSLVV